MVVSMVRPEPRVRVGQGEAETDGPILKAHLFTEHLLSIFRARGKDTEWSKVSLSSLPRPPTGFNGSP